MKKLMVFVILSLYTCVRAQNPEIKSELPTVIPPSPTVAALMKFEEVPVNNYTGIPDISIPLFSSSTLSKEINLDLILKYHSGVGANDRASDVGLGWSLFAGGTVSRTVRGLPDEILVLDGSSQSSVGKVGIYHTSIQNHNNYYYLHSDNYSQFVYNEPFEANQYIWDVVERAKFDTEHDLWQFNFMGHSGRFYIKKNLQTNELEVLPLDDYRLKINYNHSIVNNNSFIPTSFEIYDDKGIKYIFDSIEETVNKTAITNRNLENESSSVSAERIYRSAFHLSKVYDANNNLIIDITYTTNSDFKEETLNSSITVNDYIYGSPYNLEYLKTKNCFNEFKPLKSTVNNYALVTVKKIQQINVIGNSKIQFQYNQGRLDTNILNANKSLYLQKITLKSWNNQLVKDYGFEYDYSFVIDNRMILKKVTELDYQLNKNNQFDLFYVQNDTQGQSAGKDYWGYFNLVPSCKSEDVAFSNEPTATFSDTDLLQKIKYPTGGSVIFDYEANTYSFVGDTELNTFEDNIENYQLNSSTSLSFSNSIQQVLPVSTLDRKVKFYPSIVLEQNPNLNTRSFTLLKKINGIWTSEFSLVCNNSNPNCCIDYVLLKNAEYAIKRNSFDLNYNGTDYMTIDYFSKKPVELKYLYGGGNRIKQIGYFNEDVSQNYFGSSNQNSTLVKLKKFNYSLPSNPLKSSGSLVFAKPLFKYTNSIKVNTTCPEPPFYDNTSASPLVINFLTMTSFNNLSVIKTQGADVGYKNVLVEQTGIGTTEYEYTSPIDYPEDTSQATTPPFFPSQNYDYKRGLILKETIKGDNSLKINEINYSYEFDNYQVKYGFRRFKNALCFGGSFFNNYSTYVSYYESSQGPISCQNCGLNAFSSSNLCGYPVNYTSYVDLFEAYGWAKLVSKTTKNYFYPNGSTTPTIVLNTENFTYNPLNKLIAEHTFTNSKNETLVNKYFYHTGNSIYSQNRIGEIERIETYTNGNIVSKAEIQYANNWASNVSYLPKIIYSAKGANASEAKVEYINYDEFGHPREVKQANGISVAYLYGYNKTVPIAKIENATYAQVQQYEANLQTLSNGTDEQALLVALANLRTALPNAMVTTYTHKPLIGISTVTDPKGDKQTYHYDSFNRLQFVKDKDGNILSENEYHYKN